MSAEMNYSETSEEKSGMTLEELARFVCTAYAQGANGEEVLTVRTGWKAQVRRASVSFRVETVHEMMEDVLDTLARYGEGEPSKPIRDLHEYQDKLSQPSGAKATPAKEPFDYKNMGVLVTEYPVGAAWSDSEPLEDKVSRYDGYER